MQARTKLVLIQENQKEITKTIEEYNSALSNIGSGNAGSLPDLGKGLKENERFRPPVRTRPHKHVSVLLSWKDWIS